MTASMFLCLYMYQHCNTTTLQAARQESDKIINSLTHSLHGTESLIS